MRRICVSLLLSLVFVVTQRPVAAEDQPNRGPGQGERTGHPNIIVILADDFGVGDIQAHYPNNKIATPYLDRLVGQGISFQDAHSPSAVCSPTRYGLLTGRYAWRTRLQEWVIAAYEPPLISERRPTLPRFLNQHGYHTACIGKWHLGWQWPGPQPSRMTEQRNGQKSLTWDFTRPIRGGPTERGFDFYFGVDLPNLPPFTYIENDRVVVQPTEKFQPDPSEGVVLPRGFVGAPAAPDWRMQDVLPEITRRAVDHVHRSAKQNKPFFLYFSMTSPHEPVVPSADFRGKSGIAPIADFVMETDWSAGQVIEAVDKAGIAENTIVIFTADNGHSHYTGWEELVDAGHMPSGPYRGHKGDVWEGGHRVPLIVRWPNRISKGSTSDQLVSLTDLFATCADVLAVQAPSTGAEDSFSFLPAAMGKENKVGRKSLVSHSNMGEFAYRDGPWKLVFKMSGKNLELSRGKATIAELYRLDTDIAEANDLASKHPDVVERMTREFQSQIDRGASRDELDAANDAIVQFTTTQTERWAPASQSKPGPASDAAVKRTRLQFTISDSSGNPLPSRIHLANQQGEPQRAGGQPFWRDHFVCDGRVSVDLETGSYTWQIERGPEYERHAGEIAIAEGQQPTVNVTLKRIENLRDAGWYSGDLHVHRPVDQIEQLMLAEDLDVAPVITWWNARNAWNDAPIPDQTVKVVDGHRHYTVMAGEDEREGGALLYFGLQRPLDITAESREFPSPMQFAGEARRRNPKVWIDIEKPFWWDVPTWLASGQMNSIGIANNHMCHSRMLASEAWGKPRDVSRLPNPRGNGFWTQEIYYHMLNTGLRIPPSAGSASGVLPNPVGYNRVYVHLGESNELSLDAWFDSLARGECFVTNGPLLRVCAGGRLPGATLKLADSQPRDIELSIELTSNDRVPALEVIYNGQVAKTIACSDATRQKLTATITVDRPGWILVRGIADVKETFRFASTAPWYLESNSIQRPISKRSAQFFLDWVDERIERVKKNVTDPEQLPAVLQPHEKARDFWAERVRVAS